MRLSPTGFLLAALVLVAGWGGIATYRWATASARCDVRLANVRAAAVETAAEHARRQQLTAAGIFAAERADLVARLDTARGDTASRAVQIQRVPVTGACIMPAGLPSLQPAVEDARRAARD